jgi:hypothetical protein
MNFLKRLLLYLLPLVLSFVTMIIINEYARSTMPADQKSREILKMNTAVALPDACSWKCYNDTGYCKQNHVKISREYFGIIDPLYFGMISVLMATGNYSSANLIFLVILWPLLLSYLLLKPFLIQLQIKKLSKRNV